ncbi:unnamed protein product [Auanema sp. JU1783]|nr:unnamed protein product [Auanema sp. JU1783]
MSVWVFGYGSLLWYQDFHHIKKLSGVVKGYSRRFWQHSPDHRGTPEKPGRTVTLVPDEQGKCWGVAYEVPEESVKATRKYLDEREKAGYSRVSVTFYPDTPGEPSFDVEVYLNIQDNEHYAGDSQNDEIASTILYSHGASGSNLEYLLRLADILHKQAPHSPDPHVYDLEKRVLHLSEKFNEGREVLKKLGYIRFEE